MDVDAVLCDRDGTLIVDVPYNGDPDLVAPIATVEWGLARVRAAGLKTAVISNPHRCVVIGDTAADLGAAAAAGARGELVPNSRTLRHEIRDAAEVADSFGWAVEALLR